MLGEARSFVGKQEEIHEIAAEATRNTGVNMGATKSRGDPLPTILPVNSKAIYTAKLLTG